MSRVTYLNQENCLEPSQVGSDNTDDWRPEADESLRELEIHVK